MKKYLIAILILTYSSAEEIFINNSNENSDSDTLYIEKETCNNKTIYIAKAIPKTTEKEVIEEVKYFVGYGASALSMNGLQDYYINLLNVGIKEGDNSFILSYGKGKDKNLFRGTYSHEIYKKGNFNITNGVSLTYMNQSNEIYNSWKTYNISLDVGFNYNLTENLNLGLNIKPGIFAKHDIDVANTNISETGSALTTVEAGVSYSFK